MPPAESDSDSDCSDDFLGFPTNREEFLEKQEKDGEDRYAMPGSDEPSPTAASSALNKPSPDEPSPTAASRPSLTRERSSGDIGVGREAGRRGSMESQGKRGKMSRRSSLEAIGAQRSMRKLERRPSLGALDQGILLMQSEVGANGKKISRRASMERRNSMTSKKVDRRDSSAGGSKLERRNSGKLKRRNSGRLERQGSGRLERQGSGKFKERSSIASNYMQKRPSASALDFLADINKELEKDESEKKRRHSEDIDLALSASAAKLELGEVSLRDSLRKHPSCSSIDVEGQLKRTSVVEGRRASRSNSLTSKSSKADKAKVEAACQLLGWGDSDSDSEESSSEESMNLNDVVKGSDDEKEEGVYEDFPIFPKKKRDLNHQSQYMAPAAYEFDSRRPWRKAPEKEPTRQSFAHSDGGFEKVISANLENIGESEKFDHKAIEEETINESSRNLLRSESQRDNSDSNHKGSLLVAGETEPTSDIDDSDSDTAFDELLMAQAALDQALTLESRIVHTRDEMPDNCDDSRYGESQPPGEETQSFFDDSFMKPINPFHSDEDPLLGNGSRPPMKKQPSVLSTTDHSEDSSLPSTSKPALKKTASGIPTNSAEGSKAKAEADLFDRQFSFTSSANGGSTRIKPNKFGSQMSMHMSELSLMSGYSDHDIELQKENKPASSQDLLLPVNEEERKKTSSRSLLLPVDEEIEQDDLEAINIEEGLGTTPVKKRPQLRRMSSMMSLHFTTVSTRRLLPAVFLRRHRRKIIFALILLSVITAVAVVVFLPKNSNTDASPDSDIISDEFKNASERPSAMTFILINSSLAPSITPSPSSSSSRSPSASPVQVGISQDIYFDGQTVPSVPSTPWPSISPSVTSTPTATLSPTQSQVPSLAPSQSPTTTTPSQPSSAANYFRLSQFIEGPQELDFAGKSVSISSDASYLAVGFHMANESSARSGAVRVYKKDIGGNWSQFGDVILGSSSLDEFGYAVSISDNGQRIAVGARFSDDNGDKSGHARVFEYNETSSLWDQLGNIIEGNKADDRTGSSISISGNGQRVAVGSPRAGNNVGSVRILEYDGVAWSPLGQEIFGATNGGEAGNAVSMSHDGSIVAIGFPRSNEDGIANGRVSIYRYLASEGSGSWDRIGDDITGKTTGDQTGQSVSLSNDGLRVAIGSNGRDGLDGTINTGYCSVFSFANNSWAPVGSPIYGVMEAEEMGYSVSLSKNGQRVACGGPNGSPNGPRSGVVRVYEESQAGDWEQVGDTLNSTAGSAFGESISLSSEGNYLAVGAPEWDKNGLEDVGYVGVYLYQ